MYITLGVFTSASVAYISAVICCLPSVFWPFIKTGETFSLTEIAMVSAGKNFTQYLPTPTPSAYMHTPVCACGCASCRLFLLQQPATSTADFVRNQPCCSAEARLLAGKGERREGKQSRLELVLLYSPPIVCDGSVTGAFADKRTSRLTLSWGLVCFQLLCTQADVCGFWSFSKLSPRYRAPERVVRFLSKCEEDGKPVFAVGLGSMPELGLVKVRQSVSSHDLNLCF